MTARSHTQKQQLGPFIELFTLDDGATLFHFTPQTDGSGGSLVFNGDTYTPLPCEISGISETSTKPSTATLTISQLNKYMFSAIATGDVVGAKLTRIRTFEELLSSPTETLPTQIFTVRAVSRLNKLMAVFQLSSVLELNKTTLPARLCYSDEYPGLRGLTSV